MREKAEQKPVIYCLADHKRLRALVIYDAITHYRGGEGGRQLVHANAVFVAAAAAARDTRWRTRHDVYRTRVVAETFCRVAMVKFSPRDVVYMCQ